MSKRSGAPSGDTPQFLKKDEEDMSRDIKPQDLRIGNWVYKAWKGLVVENVMPDRRPCEVRGVDMVGAFVRFGGIDKFPVPYDEIEPIPLTDEIMEKCGFQYVMWYGIWVLEHRLEVRIITSGKPLISTVFYMTSPTILCRHLHELQNCYFAITGEELDVKM